MKKAKGRLDWTALRDAVIEGAAIRLRPKAMTVGSTMLGLLPILWVSGAGADTMKRIAVPMIGGMVSSFALEMLVIPAVYLLWKDWSERRDRGQGSPEAREQEATGLEPTEREGMATP